MSDEKLDRILALLETQEQRLTALEVLAERPPPAGAGTIPLPEGVPEPTPPAMPWTELDDEQRTAWIRAHTGGPGARADSPEWEHVQLPGGVGAAFPTPTPEVKAEWKREALVLFEHWAPEIKEGWLLDKQGCIDAYAESGPLWLAAYAHKYLMMLPEGMRRNMVRQVNSYAPAAGAELARDVLRASTDAANRWGYGQALDWADDRKDGIVRLPGPGGASE